MSIATQLLMEDVGSQDNVTVCTLLFGVIPDMLYDYRVHSIWKWQADKSYLYESSVGLIWDVINCQEDPFLHAVSNQNLRLQKIRTWAKW